MKYLITILFSLVFNIVYSQGVIYGNIIKESPIDTIWGTLTIFREVDGILTQKSKGFRNQFYIQLDRGNYILGVSFEDKTFFENISIDEYASLIIFNIPQKDTRLVDFDFSNAIFVSPEIFDIATNDKKIIYIEF